MRRVSCAAVGVVMLTHVCGCAIGAIGMYEAGKVTRDFSMPYKGIYEAAKSVFASSAITLKDASMGSDAARLKGICSDNTYVTVEIAAIKGASSTVTVQVGSITSPDKERAAAIMDAIGKQLGL